MTAAGLLFLVLGVLLAVFPRVLAYVLLVVLVWLGAALLYKSYGLRRKGKRKTDPQEEKAVPGACVEERAGTKPNNKYQEQGVGRPTGKLPRM